MVLLVDGNGKLVSALTLLPCRPVGTHKVSNSVSLNGHTRPAACWSANSYRAPFLAQVCPFLQTPHSLCLYRKRNQQASPITGSLSPGRSIALRLLHINAGGSLQSMHALNMPEAVPDRLQQRTSYLTSAVPATRVAWQNASFEAPLQLTSLVDT